MKKISGFLLALAFLCASTAQAKKVKPVRIKGVKRFAFSLGSAVNVENPSTFMAMAINIPKRGKGFYYVPYIELAIQHSTLLLKDVIESTDQGKISGGLLSGKLGVMLPTLVFKMPVYFYGNFAYGSVSVQSNPWFGRPDERIGNLKVHQVNAGIRLVFLKRLFFGFNFSKSDLAYIGDNRSVYLGVNY